MLRESLEVGGSARVHEILWGAWVGSQILHRGIGHIHAHDAGLSSSVAWFASRLCGVPFTFTVHSKDIVPYVSSEHRLGEKASSASRIVTVSQSDKRALLRQVPGIESQAVRVIYTGVDVDASTSPPPETRDPHLVLAVGRLSRANGFDDLLEACARLERDGVGFRCVIVGDGPEAIPLQERARDLGLADVVDFWGTCPEHVVQALLQQAAVICLPCKEDLDEPGDSLPAVLIEALACGVPVVSTAFSGIPEIVDAGVEGYLLPPGDVAGLAQALEFLLAVPELRARMGNAGREKARQRFDRSHNVGGLIELFRTHALPQPGASGTTVPKHVLMLCADRAVPFGGARGAAVHLRAVADALHADGHAPTLVVAQRDPDCTDQPAYPVHSLQDEDGTPASGSGRARSHPSVRDVLVALQRRTGFDVLYERYSLFGVGGRMAAQELGVPFVLEVNAPLVEEAAAFRAVEETDVARDVEHYLFSTADHIVCISEEMRAYVHNVAAEARTTVVPNGVDLERFDRAARCERQRRRLVPAPDSDLIVGFLGHVRPWHGVELLIDVLHLLDDCPDVHVCIAGADDGMRAALEQRAHDQGVNDRCTILPSVPQNVAPTFLKSMDILAAPYPQTTRFYSSPLKLFEYMAAARPIVASANGQLSEVLVDGTSALLVPPGDLGALADAVRRLRANPALRQRLAHAAHAEAAQYHTWARRAEQLHEIFTNVRCVATTAPEMAGTSTG